VLLGLHPGVKRSISILVAAGLLPVIGLGGTFGAITFRNERRNVEQEARTDARFAAALLAVKLQSSVQAVQMVAQTPALDGPHPNLFWFKTLAARIIATQPDWRVVTIADTAGNRLLDVPEPIGGSQRGRVVEMSSFRQTVVTGRPQIGNVALGPKRGLAFAIRAPVIKAGRVRFVVSAVVSAARLRELLLFQPLPLGWEASVVDATGRAVASSSSATQSGYKRSTSIVSWAPVEGTRWKVRVSTPGRALSAPIRNAVIMLLVAGTLCIVLLVLLARMLTQELKHSKARDEAKLQSQRMEALGRLTGGVAHDFNNLLTPIVGGLELISRRVSDERTLRYVEAAAASAERARSLVSRLLSFSRRQSLTPEAIDLENLLRGMSDLIGRSLTPAITYELDVPAGLCPVHADRGQLELAILNLVINARDAMPNGGAVRVSAGSTSAQQAESPGGDFVFIAVADTGCGMDASTMAQAVDPFFTTKPAERGTGLGLSMVHGFAAQSGGVLNLASTPGEGTVATIVLPCSIQPTSKIDGAREDRSSSPASILLVDDEVAVRRVTAEMLVDAGHKVREASSVAEALAILQSGTTPDLVITDYIMPGRSGGELIQAIHDEWPGLPVMLVTGYITAGQELPSELVKLMKPFSRSELLQALSRLLPASKVSKTQGL
jgi:signal transduction histidine kinase/ActR/RegA family two-component response regulator